MQGAREMLETIIAMTGNGGRKFCLEAPACVKRGEQPGAHKIYHEAIVRLILSNLDNTAKFLQGRKIGYRNWQNDKKGKLIKCEAYFL